MSEPIPFTPVPTRKDVMGWTASKQHQFILELAATGSVTLAAEAVGMSPRSAYRLRHHPQGQQFSNAWVLALARAGAFLLSVAADRAITGTRREVWKDGKLVLTTVTQSDRLLMFAIDRLRPGIFGHVPSAEELSKALAPLAPLPDLDPPEGLE